LASWLLCRRGLELSAKLVLASATGAAVRAVALKALFSRARADLADAAPFYPFVLLIGFSGPYLGVHYPTGGLAGYLVAAPWIGSVGIVLLPWGTGSHDLRDAPRDGLVAPRATVT
jgi:hypothetical protein